MKNIPTEKQIDAVAYALALQFYIGKLEQLTHPRCANTMAQAAAKVDAAVFCGSAREVLENLPDTDDLVARAEIDPRLHRPWVLRENVVPGPWWVRKSPTHPVFYCEVFDTLGEGFAYKCINLIGYAFVSDLPRDTKFQRVTLCQP